MKKEKESGKGSFRTSMDPPEREERRDYLKTVGALVVGAAIGGALGWLGKPAERITETVTETVTKTVTVPVTPLPTPTPTPTPTPAWSLKEAAKPYKGATIRMIGEYLPPLEAIDKLKDRFIDETGIDVVIEMYEHEAVVEKVTMDLSAKAGIYDVILNPHRELGKYVDAGWLLSLDRFLEDPRLRDPAFDPEKLFWFGKTGTFRGLPLEAGMFHELAWYKNKCYGLLDKTITRHYWYRKDLAEDPTNRAKFKDKYGYDIPDVWEMTTDQYRDLAEFFTNPEAKWPNVQYGTCLEGKRHVALWYSYLDWLHTFGGQVIDQSKGEDYGPIVINQPEAVEAMEYFVGLLPHSPPGTLAYFWDDAMTALMEGVVFETIMWNDATFCYIDPAESRVAKELGADKACGFGPVPMHPEKKLRIYQIESWNAHIPWSSKNPEAAYLFAQWTCTPEIEKAKHLIGGASGRPDVYEELRKEGKLYSYSEVAYRLYNEYLYIPKPTFPEQEYICEIIIEGCTKALIGDMSPKDTCDWMAEQIAAKVPKCWLP